MLVTAGLVAGGPTPAAADPSVPELDRQIRAAAEQLDTIVEEYNELREDLRITVAQSGVLVEQLAPLEVQVDRLRERIGTIAATAYMRSGVDGINALLTAASEPDFVRRLDVLDQLARQRQAEIVALHAARDQYQAARRTIDALAGQQREQERELAVRRARIRADIAKLRALRQRAGMGEHTVRTTTLHDRSVPTPPSGMSGAVVRFAARQIGKGYRFAADGPDAYDCSGLVVAAYREVGIDLPHSSRAQWDRATHITRAELRPGDLVFYYADIHHVAIYVGLNKMIHAPQYGESVRVDPIDHAPVHGYGRPAPST